jgi:hypothetical protein
MSSRRTPSTTTPKCSSSVYDRLYSKSTESSRRLRKSAGKEEDENSNGVSISKKNISSSSSSSSSKNLPKSRHKTVVKSSQKKNARSTTRRTGTGTKTSTSASAASSEVYNRLYSKGTVSYNSKRKMATSDTIITNVTKKTPLKSTTNNKRM